MNAPVVFADVLEAADRLDPIAQAELIAVLKRRMDERERQRIATSIEQSRREFTAGQCKPMTAAEMLKEALSCAASSPHQIHILKKPTNRQSFPSLDHVITK